MPHDRTLTPLPQERTHVLSNCCVNIYLLAALTASTLYTQTAKWPFIIKLSLIKPLANPEMSWPDVKPPPYLNTQIMCPYTKAEIHEVDSVHDKVCITALAGGPL